MVVVGMKHIVCFSGGHSSAIAAVEVVRKFGRDTFGIAVKATYAEDADGKPIMIFKNPKTDSGHFKKSQRGCCKVVYDYTYHNFFCQDGLTWEESQVGNWLQPVFKDGKPLRIYTLDEVRKNLHEGNF
jgi:nicotinamide phosphoribosyltransferase